MSNGMTLDDFQNGAENLMQAAEKALEALDTYLVDNLMEGTSPFEEVLELQSSFEDLFVQYRTLVSTAQGDDIDRRTNKPDKKAE